MMRTISGCLLLLGLLAIGLFGAGRILQRVDAERYGENGMWHVLVPGVILVVLGFLLNRGSRRPMTDEELR